MCDPVGAIKKGVGDITSAATGGLVGGQKGSEDIWGTSVNQEANPWASPLAKLAMVGGAGYLASPYLMGGEAVAGGTAVPAGGMTATGTMTAADASMMGVGGATALPAGGMTTTGSMGLADTAMMGGGVAGATAGAGAGWGTGTMGILGQGLNLATGLFGLFGKGPSGGGNADPFAQYRGQAAQQLMELQANPSLVTKQPGYTAGLDAVQRSLSAQGYMGSGNMMTELANYGTNAYDKAIQQLMTMSGASTSPAAGAQVNQAGSTMDFQAKIEALNRLGGMASSFEGSPMQKLFA